MASLRQGSNEFESSQKEDRIVALSVYDGAEEENPMRKEQKSPPNSEREKVF